ncbi:MAG: transpeptidase family protein [Chitinophagaceae bacterium]|nr:transpeptidase family protein [Chitinophagaceae bacterium]OQY94730.1 MAG: peptidoglycan glycosyltransferase [Sphingobacteriales bacterium UTBCD1]
MEVRRDILWRVYLSFLGIAALSCFVLGRAFYIQRVQGNYWRSMGDSMHQRFIPVDAERGTIYSEDGQMLSTSLPQFNIYIDFKADGLREKNGKIFKENIDAFSRSLADFFGDKSADQYKSELLAAYKNKERYYAFKKKLSFAQYKAFRNFPLVKLGRNKSGVITEVKPFRKNPFMMMAKRTIGLYRENAQNIGLERTYDSLLKGKKGKRLVRFITGGVAVPVDGYEIEPENGKDIITTMDVNIQDIAETSLMNMMNKSEARYGTCIVMETKTGKVKAMANLGRRPDGTYDEDYNYAMLTTEPGSTFKLATLLSVLSEGKITTDDKVEIGSTGKAFVGVRDVNDAERAPKPILSVKECFAHSSNIGMSKIGFKTFASQPEKFKEYLHRFRLDTVTGIDLVGEDKPHMANLGKGASLKDLVTMCFGYAVEVSPLQTLMLYNAVANDGKMMKPYLVNSVQSNGKVLKQNQPVVLSDDFCSPSVIRSAKECMEDVVKEGTGRPAFKGMPFQVAGKTGTAHVADGKLKYGDGVYQASFVGYFPANDPQYTCIVVIRTKPHSPLHYGGQLAAPVFREVATRLYAMYVDKKNSSLYAAVKDSSAYFYAGNAGNIMNVFKQLNIRYTDSSMQHTWADVYAKNYEPIVKPNEVKQQTMPDVKGMGLKDALFLLENMGLKVVPNGKGKVMAQSLSEGSAVKRGLTVYLQLS